MVLPAESGKTPRNSHKKAAPKSGFFMQAGEENYFFFLALAFGRSVMEPSNTSAARPTDSCRVG